jgi:hypothetical protein
MPKWVGKTFSNQQFGIRVYTKHNDNGARVVNFATSKNYTVKNSMFSCRNIHKITSAAPDGKMHNQIDHIWIDRRWHT